VEALVQDHEAAVEEGSNLAVTLTPGDDPRQLAYELVIAPNTTVLTGKTGIPPTPPGLVPGERYTFFVDINGHPSPDIGKFVRVGTFMSQLVIYYDASETIDIPYYKPQRDTGKYGHGKALSLAPAYQPDGSVNFRLASLGGGEPPIFTYTANGAYAMSVKGEPIALTAYSAPRETPPGLERIRPDLRSAGTWLPGHLVNGEFGGPGLNVNMVPITVKTNAKMRGNYENSLRTSLELGLYFRFEADVTYHKANPRAAVGKTTDFVEEINVKYQVIARSGSGWVNVGNVGTAGPYGDAVPTVAELDPTRVAF
jgi:hypothetical protein